MGMGITKTQTKTSSNIIYNNTNFIITENIVITKH